MKLFLLIGLLLCALSSLATPFCGDDGKDDFVRGEWLQGGWGVRVVLPGGNRSNLIRRFNKDEMINQLAELKTPRWVMLNLSEPAFSGMFTSAYPELNKNVSSLMSPYDDLLSYYIKSLKDNNYKILLYFAAQGPSLEFLSEKKHKSLLKRRPEFYHQIKMIDEKWHDYINRRGISNHQGTADIIRYYSRKYGKQIDGWWFDHGKWGDPDLYIPAARSGNSEAVVAWNGKHTIGYGGVTASPGIVWMMTRSEKDTDYTDGHVTPTRLKAPWWPGNERLIEQAEACKKIDGIRPHLFIPIQSNWRGGKKLFPEKTAIDWTNRIISSGGAITWAAALQPPEFKTPLIWNKAFDLLKTIDADLISGNRLPVIRNMKNKK